MSDALFDVIEVRAGVEAENDRLATLVRDLTREKGIYLINLMASPGAGKTSVLCRLIDALSPKYRIGVMEADMDADVDSYTITAHGAKALQLRTGTSCHVDAKMMLRGLDCFQEPLPDVIILENVGNLVCPAEFDIGADLKLMILSVPEGDEKPLKYPLMFTVSDLMLINKIDTAPIFDFDIKKCEERVHKLNPQMEIFPVSAKTGDGIAPFIARLDEMIERTLTEKRKGAEK